VWYNVDKGCAGALTVQGSTQSSMSSAPKPQKRKWWKKLFKRKTSASLPKSSGGTAHGRVSNVPLDVPQPSTPQAKPVEILQISARFQQSILPKMAGCVDENPAKMVFNILSIVMSVKKVRSFPASKLVPCITMDFFPGNQR